MKTSVFGIKQIAKREGTILHVYKDSKGLPTAGVGHLITASEHAEFPVGKSITQAQSDKWLAADLGECEDAVNSLGVSCTQNEFDALVSLAFNIGVGVASGPHKGGFLGSTVARKLKAGDKHGVAEAILLWDKPPEIQGRRRTEYNQFKTPYQVSASQTATQAAPSDQSEHGQTPSGEAPKIVEETTATDNKVVTETTPAGDPPEAPPVQVSQNGVLAKWLVGSGITTTIGGSVVGWVTGHMDSTAIIVLAIVFLICVLIFRHTITDAIRMQTASDPTKKNVT